MIKKIFCLLLCLIFPITATPSFLRAEVTMQGSDTPLSLSSLAVPEDIGKVQERFTGRSRRTIIQVQDVHAHTLAQQNIAAILERLREAFGVEKVALEGAWDSSSLPKSHAIPISREKQLLAGTLLDDDRISGPVYAAIMSPEPITLMGIENETFYEKNIALYLTHLRTAKDIDGKLQLIGAALQESQRALWGPALFAFGNTFGKFRETSDLGKFFPVLLKTAEARGADTSDLAQITLVRDIMAQEKLLEKERMEQEMTQLMREYKNTHWTLEELIRGGKIPSEKIGLYPEIKKLAVVYKMRDALSLKALTDQIETLTDRVLEKLVLLPEEKALWEKLERFYLAKKILLLQATPADLKTCEREKTFLEAELAANGLSGALALSLDFYAVVKKRDQIFFERILNDPSLAGNIAVVTGGFHTDGLSERFRDAGISYITITPELGGTAMDEKLYNERMKESREAGNGEREMQTFNVPRSTLPASADDPTLSELRNAISWIDDRFPGSYEILLQSRDVRKAEAAFLEAPDGVSKMAPITRLGRTKRIPPGFKASAMVSASELRVSEFMAMPHLEQLETARSLLAQAPVRREKAMLVSSVSILARILLEERAVKLLREAVKSGDIVALAQDVPVTKMPEILSSLRGIDRFEATDIAELIEKTPRFQRLAKKRPFAIMRNGQPGGAYVVLPEKSVSLVLFRIITLNPSLYQAAKDPAFLSRLQDLVTEILSQELSGKAA